MQIKSVSLNREVNKKIYGKHRVHEEEIDDILFNDNPVYFRERDNKYKCIGIKYRYITIIFKLRKTIADIVTAYPSSKWQIKLYKRKK